MLEISRKLVSWEIRKLNRTQQSPLQYSAMFALRHSTIVSNNRLNVRTSQELDFGLITASKNNFSEIHISPPTPYNPNLLPTIQTSVKCRDFA